MIVLYYINLREDVLSDKNVHNFLDVEHGGHVEVLQVVSGTVPLRRERSDNQMYDRHTALQERHVIVFDGIVVQSLRLEEGAGSGDPGIALLVHAL